MPEIRVVGSHCGPFPPALAALAAGDVDVALPVSECLPLDRADAALERARGRGTLKALVET